MHKKLGDASSLKTFSIGFEEKEYDEAIYAKKIANYLGTTHIEHYCTEKEVLELVSSIPQFFDEPLGDPSNIYDDGVKIGKIACNNCNNRRWWR